MILRALHETDFEQVYLLDSDPQVMRYITATGRAISRDESQTSFQTLLALQKTTPEFGVWVGESHVDGQFIGLFGLFKRDQSFDPELGYRILTRFSGQGYATEGATAIRDYGFNQLGLKRITALVDRPNRASVKVLEKLGMAFEGEREIFERRDRVNIKVDLYAVDRPA